MGQSLKVNPEWLKVADACTIWNGVTTMAHLYLWLNEIKTLAHSQDFVDMQQNHTKATPEEWAAAKNREDPQLPFFVRLYAIEGPYDNL